MIQKSASLLQARFLNIGVFLPFALTQGNLQGFRFIDVLLPLCSFCMSMILSKSWRFLFWAFHAFLYICVFFEFIHAPDAVYGVGQEGRQAGR